jgi:F-type H+-transporting ATPase subunit b
MKKRLLSIIIPLLVAAEPMLAATGHGHEEGDEGGLPQFNPEWFASQIFWIIITFVVLYLFFSRKTLPEISGVLENRREHVQNDLDTAEKLTREAEVVQIAYEKSLEKANTEASGIIREVEETMNKEASRKLDGFMERSEREISTAKNRINKAKADAIVQLEGVTAEIAAELASRVASGMKIDQAETSRIVEKLVRQERTDRT